MSTSSSSTAGAARPARVPDAGPRAFGSVVLEIGRGDGPLNKVRTTQASRDALGLPLSLAMDVCERVMLGHRLLVPLRDDQDPASVADAFREAGASVAVLRPSDPRP